MNRKPSERTSERLESLTRERGLEAHRAWLLSVARPCVRVDRVVAEQCEIRSTDSRIGGLPHMPPEMPWPMWKGVPLSHIATIQLSDASAFDRSGMLPKEGTLVFWQSLLNDAWSDEPGSFLVTHVPNETAPMELRPFPIARLPMDTHGAAPQNGVLALSRVAFREDISIPSAGLLHEDVRSFLGVAPPDLGDDESERFYSLMFELTHVYHTHQLLGFAAAEQSPMEFRMECDSRGLPSSYRWWESPEREDIVRAARRWQLLLQFDTEDDVDPACVWGDFGKLYFWIPADALRACDFSQVRKTLQCG